MSFHGFQPHNNSDDENLPPSRLTRDDISDSGYGGSVVSSSSNDDYSQPRSSSHDNFEPFDRATYMRGSSSLNRHRSPSGKFLFEYTPHHGVLTCFVLSCSRYPSTCCLPSQPASVQR